eukprot:1027853-Amphidinium_carterae.2
MRQNYYKVALLTSIEHLDEPLVGTDKGKDLHPASLTCVCVCVCDCVRVCGVRAHASVRVHVRARAGTWARCSIDAVVRHARVDAMVPCRDAQVAVIIDGNMHGMTTSTIGVSALAWKSSSGEVGVDCKALSLAKLDQGITGTYFRLGTRAAEVAVSMLRQVSEQL